MNYANYKIDFDQFIRTCERFSSPNVQTRADAALEIHDLLSDAGLEWRDILNIPNRIAHERVINDCLNSPRATSYEINFLRSLQKFAQLSPKQERALARTCKYLGVPY